METLESNVRRQSWVVTMPPGPGVDLRELGKLRCFTAGGDGVGNESRPLVMKPSSLIVANVRFVPIVTDAMTN